MSETSATHKALQRETREPIEGRYRLIANTYHTIYTGEKWEVGWDEIDVKTLEELK